MITKAKKSRHQRGSRTHGWGAGKKHRGAGNRGGRGNAGQGKRGSQKKTKYLAKHIKPIGKIGMRSLRIPKPLKSVNLKQIADKLESWVKSGKVKKEKTLFIVDIKKLGFSKVLGNGKLSEKVKIITPSASKTVEEKIKLSGGELEITVKANKE